MANDLYAYYKIANDIDATETAAWNGGQGFMPVGNNDFRFQGTLNGNGHTITGLHINRTSDYVGLFGMTGASAIVMNVSLVDCSITGQTYTGILAGTSGAEVTSCHAAGTVNGENEVGILFGRNVGPLANSSSAGSVNGNVGIGGLAGTSGVMIDRCFSTGSVDGNIAVGGLLGVNLFAPITDSYAKGQVTGTEHVGGLVGQDSQGSATNCYSTGHVTGTNPLTNGGLLGSEDPSYPGQSTYTDCFWDILTSDISHSTYGTGLSTELMMMQTSFAAWDFVSTWKICQTTNYPKLVWQSLPGDLTCPDGVDLSDLFVFIDQWLTGPLSFDIAPAGNLDGKVDLLDFAAFADIWLTTYDMNDLEAFVAEWLAQSAGSADIAPLGNPDGKVNFLDYALLAENWLTGLDT